MVEYLENNLNPKRRKTGDCSTRAICGVVGIGYNETLLEQVNFALKTYYDITSKQVVEKVLEKYGYKKMPQPRKWANTKYKVKEMDEISREELEKASLLRTPQSVLAVMPIPEPSFKFSKLSSQLTLALDGIQDPGNLGTILRIADWFGIHNVLCSEGMADVYNPKCVQSCMGALARVEVHYCNLPEVLAKVEMPVFGTFLDGKDIYSEELSESGIIVMGNEGNGISDEVAKLVRV